MSYLGWASGISGGGGSGDMLASVYDPAGKSEQVLTVSDAVAGNLETTYVGNDEPGVGSNILADGTSRIWKQASTGQVFMLTNVAGSYTGVQLS